MDNIKKQRNKNIDIIKGTCIILMVLGHTSFIDYFACGTMYLFHMAVFFIASGFLYNDKYSSSFKTLIQFFIKKIKGLWLPFFLYTEAFIILNNFFIHINIYLTTVPSGFDKTLTYSISNYFGIKSIITSTIYTVLMDNATHMGGALWFFQTLFYVLILYSIFDFLIKRVIKKQIIKLIIQGIISVLFLLFGYYCSTHNLFTYSWGRIASVYILIYFGVLMKEFSILHRLFTIKRKWIVNLCIILFSSVVLILCFLKIGTIGINRNSYINPLYFIFVSLLGWFMIVSYSNILIYLDLKINCLIEYISKRAVSIIALHFLCFKIISYVGIVINGMDERYLAAFPVLLRDGVWWLLYTIVGIVLPLVIDYCYLLIKQMFTRRMNVHHKV